MTSYDLHCITLYDLIIKYSLFIVKFPKIYILIGNIASEVRS
jgi:hypothetical protein